MRTRLLLPLLAAGVLSLTGCYVGDWNFERFHSDFHYSYPLDAAGKLSVETFNGSVEISGWDQNTVDISGTKFGPSQQEADDLPVSIDHTPLAVSVRVSRPYDTRGARGARFVIKIPRTAVLDRITSSNGAIRTTDGSGPARLRTSNGTLEIHGFKGRLDAQSSNGSVEITDIEGDATVHTSNGRIRAERVAGALDLSTSNGHVIADVMEPDQPVRVDTSNSSVDLSLPRDFRKDVRVTSSNGGITVKLPPEGNAHVMARTSNSRITSDFEMRTRGEIGKNRVDATIGNGAALLDLSTSNSGIHLRRM